MNPPDMNPLTWAYRPHQRARVGWYMAQRLLARRLSGQMPVPDEIARHLPDQRTVLAEIRALFQAEQAHLRAGTYAPPADMGDRPGPALARARAFLRDVSVADARRLAGAHQEVFRHPPGEGLPRGLPRYYRQNFHYQTDGWLSAQSASLYDHQVEVLFLGTADIMRRQVLVPLSAAIAARGQRGLRLVDIACGTGRFLREVKNSWPRLTVTGVDLSPFYLARARRYLAPWSKAAMVLAAAESLPFATGSQDLATLIYLLHELPPRVRPKVAQEAARILAPGGTLVVLDSLQRGDRPDFDPLLSFFPDRFHEPYYESYQRENLIDLFTREGFHLVESRIVFLSKRLTFRRMGADAPTPGHGLS